MSWCNKADDNFLSKPHIRNTYEASPYWRQQRSDDKQHR